MSTAVIDTLLQTVAAARPAEPRPGDDRGAFRPALDNALRGDALRGNGAPTPTTCPPPLVEPLADADEDATADDQSANQRGDPTAETAEADLADESAAEQAVAQNEADEDDDAVEISDEAETEAAAAVAAAIVETSDKALAGADATSQVGAALAGEKQSGDQRPEHLVPKNESGANMNPSATASQPEAGEIGGELPAKAAAREASSKKSGAGADGELSPNNDPSQASVAEIDEVTDDADDSPSADAAGRDGRRSAGPPRSADAPPAAMAEGDAKSPTKTGDPAPVGPTAASAPPVAAATTPEPAAARVAASIARFAAGRTAPSAANQGDETGQVDRARFVGRVEGAIRTAQQRDGRVHVRLSPPELGSLRIELTMQNGALSARLEAETPAARNLLLDNLPALRDRLAQQDIRVERFDVDVRSDSGGSNQQQNAQDRPAGDPAGQRDGRRARAAVRTAPLTRSNLGSAAATNADAALDVRV